MGQIKKEKQKGFGLAELVIVVLVVSILVVLALPQIKSSRRMFRFGAVQRQVVSVLREARQESIAQRTPITCRYENLNKRFILFGGVFGNAGDENNRIFEVSGDGVQKNNVVYGRPGGATQAALADATNLSNLTANKLDIVFQTDGSVIDTSNNPKNNALFFYDSSSPKESAFAVSVLGAGGRVKLWRYVSSVNTYVE